MATLQQTLRAACSCRLTANHTAKRALSASTSRRQAEEAPIAHPSPSHVDLGTFGAAQTPASSPGYRRLASGEPPVDPSLPAVPPHPIWVLRRRPELYAPPALPKTHRIPVATLRFEAWNPDRAELDLATGFALQAAYHLGIPCSLPAAPHKKKELQTVLRSGFVHKLSMENFHRITHFREVRAWDANEEVVNRWINYLTTHGIAKNVWITAERTQYRRPGWGKDLEEQGSMAGQKLRDEEAKVRFRDLEVTVNESGSSPPAAGRKGKGRKSKSVSVEELAASVTASFAKSGLSLDEQIKRLAEELVEKELRPRAEAAEAELTAVGTEEGKRMGELKVVGEAVGVSTEGTPQA